ncbi:hypothetical protein AVEN_185447-1, partial [Araneus ventricosus]
EQLSSLQSFERMTTARAEEKEIQCTMPQNVGLPSPGISRLQQCHRSIAYCCEKV